MVERDGTLIMVDDERMEKRLRPGEKPMMKRVRFRTLGCYPLTGAVESGATTLPEIIEEMLLARNSERQGRVIDGALGHAWKSSYHTVRAPIQVVRRLRRLAAAAAR